MINDEQYTYRVTWSTEYNEYLALCSEFPGLSFLADTNDKALKGMIETVRDVVTDMAENQEDIPLPFAEKDYSGKFQLRMTPEMPKKLAILAAEQKVSLNRYVSSKLNC